MNKNEATISHILVLFYTQLTLFILFPTDHGPPQADPYKGGDVPSDDQSTVPELHAGSDHGAEAPGHQHPHRPWAGAPCHKEQADSPLLH